MKKTCAVLSFLTFISISATTSSFSMEADNKDFPARRPLIVMRNELYSYDDLSDDRKQQIKEKTYAEVSRVYERIKVCCESTEGTIKISSINDIPLLRCSTDSWREIKKYIDNGEINLMTRIYFEADSSTCTIL